MTGRTQVLLRKLSLSALLLSASCVQQPSDNAKTFSQAELPRCTLEKPIPNRSFSVFFGRHSVAPNVRGPVILNDLANYARVKRVYRLDIFGHTDASETEQRDRGLGARRATWVRDFLSKAGIAADVMTVRDVGTHSPLVPNNPGEPEPQNRRVEFRYAEQGSVEEAAERENCVRWLRETFCKPLTNLGDALACTNAIQSL